MKWHQHAVVKILSHLGQVWVYASHNKHDGFDRGRLTFGDETISKPSCLLWEAYTQTRASHNKHHGFSRERPTFGDETISIASYCFQKISCVNIEQHECCVNFCDFSGFVWTFLCIDWVFNAFMYIIQIWTTCTCSSAYKLVEKSNMCPWVHA